MFFLKLTEISLIFLAGFFTLSTAIPKSIIILEILFSNSGWKELNDLHKVSWKGRIYTLSESIEPNNNINFTGGRIRGAALILGCTFARDLKKLFLMINYYQFYCFQSYGNTNIYNCTVELLKIIKKISLLATIMKESLMALDALHPKAWSDYSTYTFYYHLSLLQRVPKKFVSEPPLINDSLTCLNILNFIIDDFESMEKDINNDIKHCHYVCDNLNSIKEEFNDYVKTNLNYADSSKLLNYVKEKFDNEINNIVLKKHHNLGFFYNPQINMIDLLVPDELKTNSKKKSSKLSLRNEAMKNNKKSSAEIADLLDLLDL
ncbi:uncharacterized protein LOC126894327 isoform X2 [Daktulosphaira vitifoliae]|uniref:uncharacterized protein LOC126894327 isoform X2 n=1 Tax=Daktulosphaira vitifoliae TaxID=58002 RepID=UPI0021A9AAD0|nr:uncharacterized protein LOC126894327 isoform X2 [Daktulosphaira vitifoliae]XP_050521215.1 uncharacterized protein LOC126894327 isoform X2 [Daktulosphaira vitifoliae]